MTGCRLCLCLRRLLQIEICVPALCGCLGWFLGTAGAAAGQGGCGTEVQHGKGEQIGQGLPCAHTPVPSWLQFPIASPLPPPTSSHWPLQSFSRKSTVPARLAPPALSTHLPPQNLLWILPVMLSSLSTAPLPTCSTSQLLPILTSPSSSGLPTSDLGPALN